MAHLPIRDWPAGERPREKLLSGGPACLSDAELLAIFLRTGARGQMGETVIEARLGNRPPLVLGTAPGTGPVALRVELDEHGGPRVAWEWDGETSASVEGDVEGCWRSPQYDRRPPRP